jgi:hypothetical protein
MSRYLIYLAPYQIGKDELVTDTSGRHVAVMRNGRIYTFDVVHPDGSVLSPDEIKANLSGIAAGASNKVLRFVCCIFEVFTPAT